MPLFRYAEHYALRLLKNISPNPERHSYFLSPKVLIWINVKFDISIRMNLGGVNKKDKHVICLYLDR